MKRRKRAKMSKDLKTDKERENRKTTDRMTATRKNRKKWYRWKKNRTELQLTKPTT
jgi:hypothetical protein